MSYRSGRRRQRKKSANIDIMSFDSDKSPFDSTGIAFSSPGTGGGGGGDVDF